MADNRQFGRNLWRGRGGGAHKRRGYQHQLPDRQQRNIGNPPARAQQDELNPRQQENRGRHQMNAVCREPRPMRFSRLRELTNRPPTEVLFTLMDPAEGFQKLISRTDLDLDQLVLILALLARSCTSDQVESKRTFLNSIQSNQNFTFVTLVRYLCEMQNLAHPVRNQEASLTDFVTFLETLQELEPNKSVLTLTMLLPQFKETLQVQRDRIPTSLSARSETLEVKKNQCKEKYDVTFLQVKQEEKPPNDFRSIPLFPDANDINNKRPFLRPNIVDGRYESSEHYLDVQFRLLREDFVRPLRDGIASYQMQVKNQSKRLKLQDVRMYLNVHFTGVAITQDGVIYEVRFDVTPFRRIRWETNKRLIFGSLLCFSHNHFETMRFGTVAVRKPEDLAKGVLHVCMQDHRATPEMKAATFVMLETSAYFEAYRYNLMALQDMDERTLSFKEYIVELSKQVGPPEYLEGEDEKCKNYSLCPILASKSAVNIENEDVCEDFDKLKRYSRCDITNDFEWPSCDKLGLDKSQFAALKTALTKKLAIIQGPPGTGKTYVGLKIICTLLHNSKLWKKLDDGQILVICYTNHALDQFLEGVLKFTTSIVRIGGRCQSEELNHYTLRYLKRTSAGNRARPRYIRNNDFDIQYEMEAIAREIDSLQCNLKTCKKSIMTEDVLKVVMDEGHHCSLTEDVPDFMEIGLYLSGPRMPYWLGFAVPDMFMGYSEEQDIADEHEDMNQIFVAEDEEPDDLDNAGDIEYENDMRAEGDEFANVRAIQTNPRQEIRNTISDSDGFTFQGGKKYQQKMFVNELRKCISMPAEDVELIRNVWNLSMNDKRRLYKTWIEQYEVYVRKRLEQLNLEYQNKMTVALELSCEEDLLISKSRQVIAMTTTGAAKYRSLVKRLKPQIIIVEEAAEIMEAHIVTALTECTQHLILIGDHQQLRPNPTVYELAKRYKLDVSLFERMVKNKLPFCQLNIQHRMKPCISKLLVPHIYNSLEDHDSVKKYEKIKGFEKSMFFINHQVKELSERDSTSRMNLHEADYLTRLCRHLLLQGYHQKQITVLATYTGQFLLLKRLMSDPMYKEVRITVVDNFQGEENDIILLSLVRSNEEGSVGFLKVDNRVCVALSRAKKGLYCVGNFDLLKHESKLWQNICQDLMITEEIGPSLNVCCQNHGNIFPITEPTDFERVINGGCSNPCDFRLQCGHACGLLCHPYDKEHIEYKCTKVCDKVICALEHNCPKACHMPCGPCEVVVPKVLVPCGHEAAVPCHISPSKVECKRPCPKVLNCGHDCRKFCFQPCGTCQVIIDIKACCGHFVKVECGLSENETIVKESCTRPCERQLPCGHNCPKTCGTPCLQGCKVIIEQVSPCGHSVRVQCYKRESEAKLLDACKHPCRTELECGHTCSGTCSSCYQGRMHRTCQQPCNKLLVCSHLCKAPCSSSCPPCERPCENRCSHSVCPNICGWPCTPCNEPCPWKCKHHKCSRKCGEPCNRQPCKNPCKKILECQHECIGLCGEPCPRWCRVCDKKEVTDIFFGEEDEESAQFIELEDCKHIFEATGLQRWIASQDEGEIKLPVCPMCKVPIRRNLHFSTYIKTCVSKVEEVKLKTFGQMEMIREKKKHIQKILETEHYSILQICSSHNYRTRDILLRKEASTDYQYIVTSIIEKFNKQKRNTLPFLIQMENVLKFVAEMKKMKNVMNTAGMDELYSNHVNTSLDNVKTVITVNLSVMSNQLMHEISWELTRVKLFTNFMKDFGKLCISGSSECRELFAITKNVLMMHKAFREEQEEWVQLRRKKLREILGSAVIGISNEEKIQILKAMNLKQGHWYQCPNGHVYCITECGGAMIEGKCNECQAPIGGGGHRLRGDNRVATAMDGARFSAWSERFNMQNFNLDI